MEKELSNKWHLFCSYILKKGVTLTKRVITVVDQHVKMISMLYSLRPEQNIANLLKQIKRQYLWIIISDMFVLSADIESYTENSKNREQK